MPINYKEYHPKWKLISKLIRFNRAKNHCEFCRVPNGSMVKRKSGYTKIVLTVAHLDHDKSNNRFHNLKALCQRCHLGYDMKRHIANRKYGRKHRENNYQLNF